MITIVTAFPGEARPLIDQLGLSSREQHGPVSLYHNDTHRLVVTGAGKHRAAAAVGWLQETAAVKNSAWLNLGIAGHADRDVGTGVLAHRITDRESGQHWYPPQAHGLPLSTDGLITVDTPESTYPENALYDMEAAGFYPAACRSAPAELVQCYKIVSDNREHPVAGVTPQSGTDLIAGRIDEITALVTALDELSERVIARRVPGDTLARFTGNWHFTVSQQHQLEKLLTRWSALIPERAPWCDELQTRQQAGQVLRWLERHLDNLPVRLG